VREQRGPVGRIADTIGSAVRRRQRDREPRVLLYDAAGDPRVVPPGTDAHAELVEVAERLIDLAGAAPAEAEPSGAAADAEPADGAAS
jgi:hypothetical protein